jgi:hypothetical protein
MRLDTSGNLGIGTSSPGRKLEISTTLSGNPAGSGNVGSALRLSNLTAYESNYGEGGGNPDFVGSIEFYSGDESAGTGVRTAIKTTIDSYFNTNNLCFYTAPAATAGILERMRITSGGNLLVGTTSALGTGKVGFLQSASGQVLTMQNSTASGPFGIVIDYTGTAPNSTGSQFIYCNDTSGLRMELRSNGGIANYQGNDSNLSDRREKTNFAPATSYLEKICAIPVQTFNYIDQNREEDGGLTLGVVAQDVQAVAPELVTENNWGTKEEPKMRLSIYQTDLQYALMKCIQEQQALIESLTIRLTALEGK